MKIELSNVKHQKSLCQETLCYSAVVRVDGTPAVEVSNRGCGGADIQRPLKGARVTIEQLDAFLAANEPPMSLSAHGMEPVPCTLEIWCHRMVEEADERKRLERLLKSKVLFVEKGRLESVSFKGVRTIEQSHLDRFAAKYPSFSPLNTLPFEEAWKIAKPHLLGQ